MSTSVGPGDPGVQANARLTGYAAVALLVLLAVESATIPGLPQLLPTD